MNRLVFKTLVIIVVVSLAGIEQIVAQGYAKRSRKVEKSFNLNQKTKLSVSNRYGDIHINTWDKNQIDVEVTITAQKASERKAEDLINSVKINISGDGNDDLIEFVTRIEDRINNRKNENFEIDYDINMPKDSPLRINNRYGNLYLSDIDARIDIEVDYGKVRIENVNGDAILDFAYGGGEIAKIGSCDLNISYSNLDIESAKNLDINSRYSNISLGESKEIELNQKYSDLEIDDVEVIIGESKYSKLKIDNLFKELDLEMSYGGGLRVRKVHKNFDRIVLDSDYVTSELNFESGVSAKIEAQTKYGKLRYDHEDIDFYQVNTSNNSGSYKGKIGNASSPKSLVRLYSSYGSIILDLY